MATDSGQAQSAARHSIAKLWRVANLVLVGLLVGSINSAALAHASLLRTDPGDGSILDDTPAQLTLTFNEPVSPTLMRLVETNGTTQDLQGVVARSETVTVALPKLGRGTHAVSWRVISADGHPVGGVVSFAIGTATPGAGLPSSSMPTSLATAIWLAKVLFYIGQSAGVGGIFFGTWIAERGLTHRSRTIVDAALAVGLLSAIVSPGLQGADMAGVGLSSSVRPNIWLEGIASSLGLSIAIGAAAMMLALMVLRHYPVNTSRAIAAMALAGVGAATAASGHASNAPPQVLSRAIVFVHASCVALWIGSLVPLGYALAGGGESATRTLARFSALIPIPTALLVLSGLLLSLIQVPHLDELWSTNYGFVLLVKLGLAAASLAIGAYNRWGLTSAALATRFSAMRSLVRLIAIECVLALAIFGAVAGWRFTPPPRAMATVAPAAHVHIHTDHAMADISVSPNHPGDVAISIALLDQKFGPLEAKGVSLELLNAALGIEPIAATARHVEDASWRVDRVAIPAPGKWTIRVAILIDDFTEIELRDEVTIDK